MIRHTLCRSSCIYSSLAVRTKVTGTTEEGGLKRIRQENMRKTSRIEILPREAPPRPDTDQNYVPMYNYRKHRATLDPKRYSVDVAELDKAGLSADIDPPGERYVSKLVLSIKGSSYSTIRSYFLYAYFAAQCLDISLSMEPGKLVTGVYTINRSTNMTGKHKDRFKRDVWNRKLILHDISGTTADVYLSYVQRNLPAGVTMSVTEERLAEVDLEFLGEFYNKTNEKLLSEVGEDSFTRRRSIVPPIPPVE